MTVEHCATFLRSVDYGRYLTVLCAPQPIRPALWFLYAFNAELARLRSVVTREPMMGLIRLQWWHDSIDKIFDGHTQAAQEHEILAALAEIRHTGIPWSAEQCHALIDAYEEGFRNPATEWDEVEHRVTQRGLLVTNMAAELESQPPSDALIDEAGALYDLVKTLIDGKALWPSDMRSYVSDLLLRIERVLKNKIRRHPSLLTVYLAHYQTKILLAHTADPRNILWERYKFRMAFYLWRKAFVAMP